MPNFLVSLTYSVSNVADPAAAAEEFRLWLAQTKHPVVNVREVPLDDNQDFEEVEL